MSTNSIDLLSKSQQLEAEPQPIAATISDFPNGSDPDIEFVANPNDLDQHLVIYVAKPDSTTFDPLRFFDHCTASHDTVSADLSAQRAATRKKL